ncbi:glycoside hydrolase family 20 zincin-like fold domain-containing protein [Streptomyces sp. S.PB5]|uniref:glycoside hydrolase family 20 zincin-like fold domain-containing protein n=1 Tax=Streptomyces sp. S.PB5 TaxID=3020844 RepID=UPI0025AEF6A5|nr:glycoside hydrolase family 20 zincin-like fold domain-containing protein [Streptomyces sp. S.PB5]MDN3021620.1 glycoside hydrolase family 20 zincin-like fold domain-containing protein [Streptomyces sp. S.PB5]
MDEFTLRSRLSRRSARVAAVLLTAAGLTTPSLSPASAAPRQPAPEVWPRPQSTQTGPGRFTVPDRVVEVVGPNTDASAREVVETALREAGADRIVRVDKPPASAAFTVYLDGPGTTAALKRLGARSPAGLPSGGYALASGRRDGRTVLALSGSDATGTFYAAQTLRQLLSPSGKLPQVRIRDWPTAALRGVIEGFLL